MRSSDLLRDKYLRLFNVGQAFRRFVYTIPGMKRLRGLLGPQPVKDFKSASFCCRSELTVESYR
jgi:hypothetical protein